MNRIVSSVALRRPRLVYLIVLTVTLVSAAFLPRINIDTDPENMLPSNHPDRVFHNAIEERFGLHDALVVGVVNSSHAQGVYNVATLTALHQLTTKILQIDGVVVPDVMSLSLTDNITQGQVGEIRFERMMPAPPADLPAAQDIQANVDRLPLLLDTLVSADNMAAAIYVPIRSKDLSYPISVEIQSLADQLEADATFHITGLPVAEDTFGVEMFKQMAISAPLAGLMIFILMWYFFRSVRLVIAPMIVAIVTVVIVMGALIGMGFTVHIMSSMIPIFLMPIAVVDSVHILSEFADHYDEKTGISTSVERVVEHLYKPMLFTSLTTSIGFASLLLTPIPPVQVFGAFVAVGVLLAFVVTIFFIPAYVVRMKPRSLVSLSRLKSGGKPHSPLANTVRATGKFAFGRGGIVLGITGILLTVSIAGVMRIEINDNPVRWFKEAHRIRVADSVLNAHFAGTYDAFLVLEHIDPQSESLFRENAGALLDQVEQVGVNANGLRGLINKDRQANDSYFDDLIVQLDDLIYDIDDGEVDLAQHPLGKLMNLAESAQTESKYFQNPKALHLIEALQQSLMDTGGVGKTNALPDVVKVVTRELRSGSGDDYVIPATSPAVAQTLLQYQSSHRPQDLWHMVTPDFRSTAIWLQLKSGDNQDMASVIAGVDRYLAANPLPDGVVAKWAGKTYINVVWQDDMVAGMLKSLLGAFVIVFVMMAVLFRSPSFGLLAMVPLTVTIVAVYGLIGWIGKDYDMPMAVLSSLTLGLSVDFAIHFIQRMRSLVAETGSFEKAASNMFEEPGRAIARNAIVIAFGFTPLFLAALVPYITVGAFMASIMVISGLATLLILPAIMSCGSRWFFSAAVQKPRHGSTNLGTTG